MVRAGLQLTAVLLLLLAALALKGLLVPLPAPPAVTPTDQFDANRAVRRLARVLGDERAHPVDSAADDAVRERLVAELRALGLRPQLRDEFVCNGFARRAAVACARVRNVVATIGPRRGRHLLLSAHYDSTFAGPGAADAGIGIAALLETAALMRERVLSRPVTFLFNEGEEMGLLGARAFLDRDPLAPRIGALLNFEARGVTGPATMFETSRPNGPAIARFARAVDRPVANSLTTDLYRLIPNSTDVAVFEALDWTILNFAIIGNETRYHSAGDNLAALDRRSVQHMGEQALALTLDFATRPAPAAQGERLYADLLGRQLVTVPVAFGLILLGLLLLFFLVETGRRKAFARPLGGMAIAVVGSGGVAFAGLLLVGLLRDGEFWRGYPAVAEIAVYGSALGTCLAALLLVAGEADRRQLRAAYWLLFLAGGAALASIAPGAAIFFLFPPLASAAGMALERRRPGAERVGAILAILLLFLSFAPALHLFEELMSTAQPWIFAPIGAVMLLPAVIELTPLAARLPRILVLAGAGDLFLIPWIVVALTPAYSADRRQQFVIEYVWDQDAHEGRWAVNNDGAPVPFPAAWRRAELPHSTRERWVAPAPDLAVTAPSVAVVDSRELRRGRRLLTLRLSSHGAESVSLVAPAGAELRAAGTARKVHAFGSGGAEDKPVLRCIGRACDGALLVLVTGRDPVDFTIVGTRTGLPPAAAPLVRARPALARPQYAPDSTIAMARVRL